MNQAYNVSRFVSRQSIMTFVMVLMMSLLMTGCGTKVSRVGVDETIDLSGRWNDSDSRLVSETMVRDLLSKGWYTRHLSQGRGVPVIIIGDVRNLSHEHINVRTFVNDIERELINSGEVEFVASSAERSEIRDERLDQDLHASVDTRKVMGEETGADYMLKGAINTIIDREGKKSVKFYQVDLNLISLKDNRKLWVGQKKIKKMVKKKAFRL